MLIWPDVTKNLSHIHLKNIFKYFLYVYHSMTLNPQAEVQIL